MTTLFVSDYTDVNAVTITNLPTVIQVNLTNPDSLSQRYRKAHDHVRRYDHVMVGLEDGTRTIVKLTLKSMVYFAIECINDPTQAAQLDGWDDIKFPGNANPYLRPMKYITQGMSSSSLRSKLSQWAAIAQHVDVNAIAEDHFLYVLARQGGINRWYRKLEKDGGKGGRPKGYRPADKVTAPNSDNSQLHDMIPDLCSGMQITDKVLHDSIPARSEAGRQLVCVLFDITDSAHFADANALIARLHVLSEYVGVMGTANQAVSPAVDAAAAQVVAP